jgi:signal transduction histidine kinase
MKTQNKQIQTKQLQAEKINSVGYLAGGIAHEFNNLHQVFRGNVELLQIKKEWNSEENNHLDQIESKIAKAKEIINSLLVISSIKHLELRSKDANALVKQTADLLCRTMPQHVAISTSLAHQLPLIEADPHHLSQAIIELVKNGCEVISPGTSGTIEIRTELVEPDKDSAVHSASSQSVLLSISDSGNGICDAVQESIFDPFFTTKEPGKGTGLGLPFVYSVVHLHQGDIVFSTDPRAGSCFTIVLPSERSRAQQRLDGDCSKSEGHFISPKAIHS